MDSISLDCGICNNPYSEEHKPRILPCSHSLCEGCINSMISSQECLCPFCRKPFTADSAEDIVMNRDLLAVAIQFSNYKIPENTSKTQEISLSKVIEDFNKKRRDVIAKCQAVKLQSFDATRSYAEMKEVALEFNKSIVKQIENLEKQIVSSEKDIDYIDQKNEIMKNNLTVLSQEIKKLEDFSAKLQSVKDFSSGGSILDETENVLKFSQEEIKKIQNSLQETGSQDSFMKKKLLKKIWMKRIEEVIEKGASSNTVVDITVDELIFFRSFWMKFIQGNIFAIERPGRGRVANIRFESDNEILMSHLKEQDIPPESFVIKHDTLLAKTSHRAFMDLGFDGAYLGRIIIKVMSEGNYAQKFLHLCTGDLGPSYAKSQFSKRIVYGLNREEFIVLKEPLVSGVRSTDFVLPEVNWEDEEKRDIYECAPFRAGDVRGLHSSGRSSSFFIVTEDKPLMRDTDCFGTVEEGLGILRNIELQDHILSRLNIIDFGLIFYL